jgi:uncharacterized membrane protein
MGISTIIFSGLLKNRTIEGRALLDKVEGFKLYLSVAEGDELRAAVSENKTIELFEKYLPYAIALDVEQQWAARFQEVISRMGPDYSPNWYSGSNWNSFRVSSFASGLGNSIAGTISSSSTAPGSSSGSGGGGFSGGGGGGGGGGGW